MGYAFISYSSKNKDSADAIKSFFNKNNIDTWMAPNDIPVGSKYVEVISKAIKSCSCFVLLLTDNSQSSIWVSKEVERAINYKKTIIPIQLEEVVLNDEFEMYISTDQILPIRKIDDTSIEMQNLLTVVNTHIKATPSETEITPLIYNSSIEVGSVIDGRYKVISELGKSSYGEVFLAVHEKTKQQWVIKVVYKNSDRYRSFIRNPSAEFNLLNHLDHPGIPSVVDYIDSEKYGLFVMNYIAGDTLSRVIQTNGAQDETTVLECAIQLCDIVGYLHSQKPAIIYNDLQPGNIMLKPEGNIMLINVGTSQNFEEVSQDMVSLGNSYYKAPEKLDSRNVDQRADIYSIGAVLYSMITGNDPSTPPHIIYPIRKANPGLSSGFEYIISKCMESDPNDRYQNTQELLNDLHNVDKITYKMDNPTFLNKVKTFFKKTK